MCLSKIGQLSLGCRVAGKTVEERLLCLRSGRAGAGAAAEVIAAGGEEEELR